MVATGCVVARQNASRDGHSDISIVTRVTEPAEPKGACHITEYVVEWSSTTSGYLCGNNDYIDLLELELGGAFAGRIRALAFRMAQVVKRFGGGASPWLDRQVQLPTLQAPEAPQIDYPWPQDTHPHGAAVL